MLLRTDGLTVTFAGLRAVSSVDLEVGPGRLVGLIGPNGAGKTTFVDALTGFVPASGRVELEGQDITGLPAHRRARTGLARTWQSLELFDEMTVAENLQVAADRPSVTGFLEDLIRPGRTRAGHAVDEALAIVGLADAADRLPTELSLGDRKLVGVARALAAGPRVLCLDEPAAGLDTAESEALGRRLRQVVETGVSILLIDHDMGLVLGVSDDVYVLDFGEVIAHGSPGEIRRDERVIGAYLGSRARAEHAGQPG